MANPNQILDRFVYPCDNDKEILLDDNGLLLVYEEFRKYSNIIDLSEFSQLHGAILLAEGGMGKTTFMNQLKSRFPVSQAFMIELGRYSGDPNGLRKDIESFIQTLGIYSKPAIIFDGLDEAQDLSKIILRLIGTIPKRLTIWIASRDIISLSTIQSEYPELKSYNMAPLSENNIREMASHEGLDEDSFLEAAHRQGIFAICSKPLGCKLAMSVFRDNGLIGVSQRDLWHLGIERLCDETPSLTKRLLQPSSYELNVIVDCAAWLAICLSLSGKVFFWVGEPSYCPKQSVDISSLASKDFPLDLIRLTLERGVFTPMGDGRLRFTHATFLDYLTAYGFSKFIPSEHWSQLLLNNDRKSVLLQRFGIATWLTAFNKDFLKELSVIQPELLLSSMDAVLAIGPSKLCKVLLDRSDTISYKQRHNSIITNNLSRLSSPETSNILRDRLLADNKSENEVEFILEIAEACKFIDLSNILVDRVFDETLSFQQRVDASYTVYRLADVVAQGRLKTLLPVDPKKDLQDDLRGNILRCCWPNHLTPNELLSHLVQPQKPNYLGSYGRFIDYDLPNSFKTSITEINAPQFLKWSIPHFIQPEPFDSLGRLARSIYTYCWQWAKNYFISTLLAEGYLKAEKNYTTPFLNDLSQTRNNSNFTITIESFRKDTNRRLAVLKVLLESDVDEKTLMQIPFSLIPLFQYSDTEEIINKILSNPSGSLVKKWGKCLRTIVKKDELIQYKNEINQIHNLLPEIIDSAENMMKSLEDAQKQHEEYEQKLKKQKIEYNSKRQEKQTKIDAGIKTTLHQIDLKPDRFPDIALWLFSENGYSTHESIDLTQSTGWNKLSSEEQEILIALSEQYLLKGCIEKTSPGQFVIVIAQAFYLLFKTRFEKFQCITREVWRKWSVELLKAALDNSIGQLGPLFDTLAGNFPEIAEKALLEVINQELSQDRISITHYWGTRLTNAHAKAILQIAKKPTTSVSHNYLILSELIQNGQAELVSDYLDSIFSSNWESPPNQELNKHLLLAFTLNPHKYSKNILEMMNKYREWGRQWIEMAVMDWERILNKAIIVCIPDTIADFFIWLHTEYPENTRPKHRTVVFSPGPIDNIHESQNYLLNVLVHNGIEGSVAALKKIQILFPNENWLNQCIMDAQINEQANKAPMLTITEIKLLADENNSSRHFINSIQDLHKLVSIKLNEYKDELQGDTPAIGDLWNSPDPIYPKKEDDLSDHLKRFLDKTLPGVIINREVQIRRKQCENGTPGSKTDIWIQVRSDKDEQIHSLCIEVKCNWNPDAKTAIKNQLIEKYMSGGKAKAGILLLGWFACKKWDRSDYRRAESTKIWSNINSARTDLEFQVEQECKLGHFVSAIVIDCSLE